MLTTALLAACAATSLAASEPDSSPWTFKAHAGVWYAGVAADVTMPRAASGAAATLSTQALNLNAPRLTPSGEVSASKGPWLIELRGFAFDADAVSERAAAGSLGDVDFNAGQRLKTTIDVATVELAGGHTLADYRSDAAPSGAVALAVDLRLVGGVRLIDSSVCVSLPGGGTGVTEDSADALTAHPLLGLRADADFQERFSISLEITGGWLPGTTDSSGFDIVVGGQWRPVPNVGVNVGYRALFLDLSSGQGNESFELGSASLQGLFAGVGVRF
ncbi:MAG: hypothetical protein WCK33_02465 [Phycisphaerae bacterium]|jgi:hypothetical protein